MEPNIDRGMWSVVALLAAIVIGGVVLIAFPKISGKIANSMDSTVDEAFIGNTPSWVVESEEKRAIKFLDEVEKISQQDTEPSYVTDFHTGNKNTKFVKEKYKDSEWGVSNASYFEGIQGKRKENYGFNIFAVLEPKASIAGKGNNEEYYTLMKNEGDTTIRLKFHSVSKYEELEPGETKFFAITGDITDAYKSQIHVMSQPEGTQVKLKYYKPAMVRNENIPLAHELLEKHGLK